MIRIAATAIGLLTCALGSAGAQTYAPQSYAPQGQMPAPTMAAAQADGPLITPEQMAQGTSLSQQECQAYRSTVYVVASGVGLCFRYYLSTAGGQSNEVVYFLSGDHPADKMAYEPAKIDHAARKMSQTYGRPYVHLARMGIDGSSGSHKFRRTWFEVEATHLAIDAINARHGFSVIHVMGQSGGGHLTGALVGTRSDIGCAIPGSGRLAFDQDYAAKQARRPAHLRHYSPDTALPRVVQQSRSTRILVVTDPNDQRVPAHMQAGFVQAVQRSGGLISQFYIRATDPLSHGATPYTRKVMSGCLERKSDTEIQASLVEVGNELWTRHAQASQTQPGYGQPRQAFMPQNPQYMQMR